MITQQQKDEWVAALRSGEYQQGPGALCKVNDDGSRRYCCLGVLGSLLGLETSEKIQGLVKFTGDDNEDLYTFLAPSVLPEMAQYRLGELNDSRTNQGKDDGTFRIIADFINSLSMEDLEGLDTLD